MLFCDLCLQFLLGQLFRWLQVCLLKANNGSLYDEFDEISDDKMSEYIWLMSMDCKKIVKKKYIFDVLF